MGVEFCLEIAAVAVGSRIHKFAITILKRTVGCLPIGKQPTTAFPVDTRKAKLLENSALYMFELRESAWGFQACYWAHRPGDLSQI